MAAPQIQSAIAPQTLSDAELLAKYQERCRRLNAALEAERAKTSKLRRYIARLNVKPDSLPSTNELANLQALVADQNKLLDQIYNENQVLREQLTAKTTLCQQLTAGNEKLKGRIIQLRRQVLDFMARRTSVETQ